MIKQIKDKDYVNKDEGAGGDMLLVGKSYVIVLCWGVHFHGQGVCSSIPQGCASGLHPLPLGCA